MKDAFKPIRFILHIGFYVAVAWALGLSFFALKMPKTVPLKDVHADAVVVLTGGAGRLEAGGQLMKAGAAKRMLISGVHPDVTRSELHALIGMKPALINCCVDLDYVASSTLGNAQETALWAKKHGYSNLIVVTANYHIPRSMALFRREIPDAKILPYPVEVQTQPFRLAREYSKYIVTLMQEVITL